MSRYMRGVMGLIRFGGLIGVHRSAEVAVAGRFEFGRRVSIGRNTVVQVNGDAMLKLGEGVSIGREAEVSPRNRISIGNFTSIQDRCILLGEVEIGAHCLFAPGVYISSGTHQYSERPAWLIRDQDLLMSDPAHHPRSARQLPILVEDDCWLGINVVVMRGVSIGRGCVVGANSVVTRSVAPYSIVAGAPAKLLDRRLDFIPPRFISSERPEDMPYFYSGFDHRQSARTPGIGISARGLFRIALDCAGATELRLELEAPHDLRLRCESEDRELAPGAHAVVFRLQGDLVERMIAIEAVDRSGRPATIRLRRASVEN